MTTTMGERIRDLRKKHDLTQEKLADFLGMSYQSVSKWECNLTSPDLSLIGPLTKHLGVTSDELLGLTEGETDERKAYFDAAMERWHDDDLEEYARNAEAAVREFPGDPRYLAWHDKNRRERYIACDAEVRMTGVDSLSRDNTV